MVGWLTIADQIYLIGLGSNQPHPRFGKPPALLAAAIAAMEARGLDVLAVSPVIRSRPIGPSQRDYANAAAVVQTALYPRAMLALLQQIEAEFGRKRRGARWRARVIDLDIVLWSGGFWADDTLQIPHPALTQRAFVLQPAAVIAGAWRDPASRLTLRQLVHQKRIKAA